MLIMQLFQFSLMLGMLLCQLSLDLVMSSLQLIPVLDHFCQLSGNLNGLLLFLLKLSAHLTL
jgi:hypothetical protein